MRPGFGSDVRRWLHEEGYRSRHCNRPGSSSSNLLLVRSAAARVLVLHLLTTPRSTADVVQPAATAMLTEEFAPRRQTLINLWEDQWSEHSGIVRSRLLTKLGRSERLMARTTTARRIDAATLDTFLLDNHLWGATKARYRYGLYDRSGDLVAVASFSARWKVRRHGGEPRASHELIRYCSRRGETVVGGITKLIAAFRRDASPDEIVTVIDRDWGEGGGWSTIGFQPLKSLPQVQFYVGPDGRRCHLGGGPNPHRRRLPDDLASAVEQLEDATAVERFLAQHSYYPVHDAGAQRHLLKLTQVEQPP